jgi:WD40 repeat protein
MDAPENPAYEYQVGGSLKINASCYVWRQADDDLYASLQGGAFCYVFNCRQMGKSSLRVQVMQRLKAEGVSCGAIDLTTIGGGEITADQWYRGLILELHRIFKLSKQVNLKTSLADSEQLPPVQRLSLYLEEVLLTQVAGERIVIFIDEIDSVLKLNFPTSDFFALIRACYNQRADNPVYERLTFVLLGVATPMDLVQDAQQTPFNIGCAIPLEGLAFEKSAVLAEGLVGKAENPRQVLQEILWWTGGQPFLTQKLCQIVQNQAGGVIRSGEEADGVKQLVQAHVLNNWEFQDDPQHLRTIRDRLLNNEQKAGRLLGLYQQILEQGGISADGISEQIDLQLTGLVVKRGNKLEVYNPIYREVFNRNWVEEKLTQLRPSFYGEAIKAWLGSQRKDDSYLLRGQALQNVLAWAASRSLSEQDYQFLTASQELDKRQAQLEKLEAEIALEIETKKKKAAEEANKILNRAYQKARLIIAISLLFALGSSIVAGIFIKKQQKVQKVTQIEVATSKVKQQFKSGQLAALISSVQLVEDLESLIKENSPLEDYPTLTPIFVLQDLLNNIYQRNQFDSHLTRINTIDFHPSHQQIISGGEDGTVQFWSLTGRLLKQWKSNQEGLNYFSVSPNKEQIAVAGADGKVQLWNFVGEKQKEWTAHLLMGGVNHLSFSPDGKTITTAGGDGIIRLWDLSGKQIAQWKAVDGEFNGVSRVIFNPNGQQILSAGQDGKVRLWNLSGKELVNLNLPPNHNSLDISFSPNGDMIATAGDNGVVMLWDSLGKSISQIQAHQGAVTSIHFSPDGKHLVTTGGDDATVKLWNLLGQKLAELPGHQGAVLSANFSQDGKSLVSAGYDGIIRLWDVNTTDKEPIVAQWQVNEYDINSLSFSPDNQKLVTVGDDGKIRIWNRSGKQISEWSFFPPIPLKSVSFSPNGQYIAVAGNSSLFELYDLKKQKTTKIFGTQTKIVTSVHFSTDGKHIVTSSIDGIGRLWDYKGKLMIQLNGHQGVIWNIKFSPNGQQIATAGEDNTVRIWNLSGQEIAQLSPHQDTVRSIAFSPNGQQIVTAGDESIVRLWNVRGHLKTEFNTYQTKINSISFSVDGQRIATAGIDGTIRVWDTNGRQLLELKSQRNFFWDVSFSSDSRYLVAGGSKGQVALWRIEDVPQLLERSCHWLKDYLKSHPEELKNCVKITKSD